MRPSIRAALLCSVAGLLLTLTGCDDTSSAGDAGNDAGQLADAGGSDAGQDAGAVDAGVDAGIDAGVDAGAVDAGCASPAECPAGGDCTTATCTAGVCGTMSKTTGSTCASSGGHLCDGAGACVACVQATDCTPPASDCVSATCQTGVCGTASKAAGTTCASNGGHLCDGTGACLSCLTPSDCPATGTACAAPTCSMGTCGVANAALGTACTDHSGVVCTGTGTCSAMHCADGVQDADESDVDCGGSCGATCGSAGPQQKCRGPADCASGVCNSTSLLCQPPSCSDAVRNGTETDVDCGGGVCPSCSLNLTCRINTDCTSNQCSAGGTCTALAQGQACSSAAQCGTGNCVSGVCCNSACNGTCVACSTALTGLPNGTCASQSAGSPPAVPGQCMSNGTTCGNTGLCGAGGSCQVAFASTLCAPASCSGSTLTQAANCNGAGSCAAVTPMPCPGGYACASASSCRTTCNSSADCAASTPNCNTTSHTCGP